MNSTDKNERIEQGSSDFKEVLDAQANTKGKTYSDFLKLDELLALQPGLENNSESLLFFTLHQTKELWMRVMYVETLNARDNLFEGKVGPALKILARIRSIQQIMIESWSGLATMTPVDYLSFRDKLGSSSGFQSPGYRKLEFILGQKEKRFLIPHEKSPHHHSELKEILSQPSLYDSALHYLNRAGILIPKDRLERNWAEEYTFSQGVYDAWKTVYKDTETYFNEYHLAEVLVDIEYDFQLWRFKHFKTVERIIGNKTGTGGSSGVQYLKLAIDRYFYPELWEVRGVL